MVETMMRLKPVAERTPVTAHFRARDQSLGLEGSVGRVKVMRKGSEGDVEGGGETVGAFSVAVVPVISLDGRGWGLNV